MAFVTPEAPAANIAHYKQYMVSRINGICNSNQKQDRTNRAFAAHVHCTVASYAIELLGKIDSHTVKYR